MTLGQKEPSMYSAKSHFIFNNRRDLLAPPPWYPRILSFLLPWGPKGLLIVAVTRCTRRAIVPRLSGMIDSRSPIALDKVPGGHLIQIVPLGRARAKGKTELRSSVLGTTSTYSERRFSVSYVLLQWDRTEDHVHSRKQDQVCEVRPGLWLEDSTHS